MIKKTAIGILTVIIIMVFIPYDLAYADSEAVLIIYSDEQEMYSIADIVKACGMSVNSIESSDYRSDLLDMYNYIIFQDGEHLREVVNAGKKVVCIGEEFDFVAGFRTATITRSIHANLSVYGNSQSIVATDGLKVIEEYRGEPIGEIDIEGRRYPLGVVSDKILYAPYFNREDVSVFAVGQMLNNYFGLLDGGKMYVAIDEVYPFDNLEMLQITADKLYKNGIPFIVTVMPVYNNTDYPSFQKYCNTLSFMQSKSGSLLMHDPLITGYELVGDTLETKLEKAYTAFETYGLDVKEQSFFPFEVSEKMLAAIHPENELFISLPIETVIKYGPFETEDELDLAVDLLNKKWIQIGDFGASVSNDMKIYNEIEVDAEYVYRPVEVKSFEFIMNAGNQGLIIIVVFSAIIIVILMAVGFRIYRSKFVRSSK